MPDIQKSHLFYDVLTGLPNRMLLEERMQYEIGLADRHNSALALMILNPFPLSEINSAFGYDVGDALLRELGERLSQRMRKVDTVAHLSGDEFALLLPEVEQLGVVHLCQKVEQWFEEPFEVLGESIFLGVNMGVATYPLRCSNANELIRGALMAAREAKQSREPKVFYHGHIDDDLRDNLKLFGSLREAIQHDRLNLNFQPQVEISSGRLAGVETLSRWDAEQISPARFIPVAETTGLIRDFTRWMIRSALQQAANWQEAGYTIPVSMNVSVRDLLNPSMGADISHWLDTYNLSGYPLVIEVTESAVMEHASLALRALNQMRDYGFHISIDDFGTGYSSLAYLRDLPASELKIDQSFIFGLSANRSNQKLVRVMTTLAHEFDMKLVAEGVETQADLELLAEMGCDVAQGFHISRPLASDQLLAWIREDRWPKLNRGSASV